MPKIRPVRAYTTKQMGDACEMLVAAELTLAGIPALKVPDFWPDYDIVAQPKDIPPQRISVKSRTFKTGAAFVDYKATDRFEWLAIVILLHGAPPARRFFVIPRDVVDSNARRYGTEKTRDLREFRIDEVQKHFGIYENNFALKR